DQNLAKDEGKSDLAPAATEPAKQMPEEEEPAATKEDDLPKVAHPEPSDPRVRSDDERFIDQRPDDPGVRPGAEPAKGNGFRLFN
ncbi:MAG: hypothetical protein AAF141_09100, partial [Pseudomonadota bacterium]